MTTINKAAYKRLIEEDINWVLKQPRTLERDHVVRVLEYSVDLLYPEGGFKEHRLTLKDQSGL